MKNKKKLIAVILFSALFTMILSLSAFASGKRVVKMAKSGNIFYNNVYNGDYSSTVYHKITIPANGALGIGARDNNNSGAYIQILNSKRKAVSTLPKKYVSDTVSWYGLVKGTYYIKVTGEYSYYLEAKFLKRANNGATYRSGAKTIARNKSYSGILSATEKWTRPDWYKFYLPIRSNVRFDCVFYGQGSIDIQILAADGNYNRSTYQYLNSSGSTVQGFTATRTAYRGSSTIKGLNPGTYYVKVARRAKGTSAGYTIKWSYDS